MPLIKQQGSVYARPAVPILISLIIGILIGTWFAGFRVMVFFLVAMNGLLLIYRARCGSESHVFALSFISLMGYLSIQPWLSPVFPANHIIHRVDHGKYMIQGTVASTPTLKQDRCRFVLEVEHLAHNGSRMEASGRIRVTVYGAARHITMGDHICFHGRIRSIRNFNNPGGFNYRRYMGFKKIWGTSHVSCSQIDILKKAAGFHAGRWIEDKRQSISRLIDSTVEGDHRGVLKALIIGQTHEIPSKTRQAFNRSGVGHLLAISGLHIGIIAAVSFFLVSRGLARIHYLLWNGWIWKAAAVFTFLPILSYALISGMSPSTQRALLMVSIFLLTFLLRRDQDLLNTLSIAAILILLVHPPSIFSISFQLSFVSVFFIIHGLSWLKKSTTNQPNGVSRIRRILIKIKTFILVSFFATLGTLPIVMYYFNQIPLVGLVANLICVPLIGFMVVPLGLSAAVFSLVNAQVSIWILNLCAMILNVGLHVIQFLGDLSISAVKTITPSFIEIGCFYLVLLLIFNLHPSECSVRNKKPGKKHVYSRQLAGLFLVFLVLGIDVLYWMHQRFWAEHLKITIIDVGQGSANLLELPGGKCIMIDGGGFSDNSIFDIGERVVAPYLWRKKIATVDTLILSHPNSDHLNGLIYIATHFNVKKIWTNSEERNTVGFHEFESIISSGTAEVPNFMDLERNHIFNKVKINILYPPRDYSTRREKEPWRVSNNNSIVIKVSYGSFQFMFPGDIMVNAEKEIIRTRARQLKSTVLVAPHHGSKTSSSMAFLNLVKPDIAVFSVGWNNRYHFPHPSIVERYKKSGCSIYRTDVHGSITLLTDGRTMDIIPYVQK